jgi:sugar-specific transcriptional regulator TrmB
MLELELQKIGLTEKEASVYLAALRLGKSPVQIIAKEAKVNRGTAYNIIDALTKKGLISSYQEGKKQYFFAESPDQLELLFKQQLEEIEFNRSRLKELLPELKQMDNKEKDKPVVRYFEGKNGIRAMVEDMFDVEKGTEIVMVYPYDVVEGAFSSSERESWKNKRTKSNVMIKAMYTKKDGSYPRGKTNRIDKKIPMDKYSIKSDIAVYENRIRIASFGDKNVGIIIENRDMADTLKSILNLAWKGLDE